MAKFVAVSEAPATLEKGELVIKQPDFMDEIVANQKKAPRNNRTAVNHIREILQSIGVRYDSELNAMRIPLVMYTGVPYKDNTELSAILVRILKEKYPQVFNKVLDYQLKHRPQDTKLVYYVGNFSDTTPFYTNGLDHIDEKDVEAYMTGKPKKTVGKPAITSQEAKERADD